MAELQLRMYALDSMRPLLPLLLLAAGCVFSRNSTPPPPDLGSIEDALKAERFDEAFDRMADVLGEIAPRRDWLAARARGLGTCWTTLHLRHERQAAELLGIPYDRVMQAALIPVAHTIGEEFRPGPRKPLDSVVHWEHW